MREGQVRSVEVIQGRISPTGKNREVNDMNKSMSTSYDHIDALVRNSFGIEPDAMAALAHGDEIVRLRRLPDTAPTTDPLDGVEVALRRIVAISVALRGHPGAVSLVTERQTTTAGWPCASLANHCIVLAYALAMTEPTLALPLLIDADETAGEAMTRLIRVGDHLPALEALLGVFYESNRIDPDALERVAAAREHAPDLGKVGIVSIAEHLTDWLGVDAEGVELPTDRRGPRLNSRNARAVGCCAWLITSALDLGSVMVREATEAVRLKTEHDAKLGGAPGAVLANFALLLGAAIRHGGGYTVQFLQPKDGFAAAVVEAGCRIRERRLTAGYGRESDEGELMYIEELELEDVVARGYVHVGRDSAKRVAWRQVRGED